jgi:hypothetical protein
MDLVVLVPWTGRLLSTTALSITNRGSRPPNGVVGDYSWEVVSILQVTSGAWTRTEVQPRASSHERDGITDVCHLLPQMNFIAYNASD